MATMQVRNIPSSVLAQLQYIYQLLKNCNVRTYAASDDRSNMLPACSGQHKQPVNWHRKQTAGAAATDTSVGLHAVMYVQCNHAMLHVHVQVSLCPVPMLNRRRDVGQMYPSANTEQNTGIADECA